PESAATLTVPLAALGTTLVSSITKVLTYPTARRRNRRWICHRRLLDGESGEHSGAVVTAGAGEDHVGARLQLHVHGSRRARIEAARVAEDIERVEVHVAVRHRQGPGVALVLHDRELVRQGALVRDLERHVTGRRIGRGELEAKLVGLAH